RLENLKEMKRTKGKKMEIRQTIRAKRESLSPEEVNGRSERIKKCFLRDPDFQKTQTIVLYVAFRNEVDTLPLIKEALVLRKKVGLPRTNVRDRSLTFYHIQSLEDLVPGHFGILEPKK
ncbi:MAG: hypothetical protein COX46_00700, partial [bacterium (Candidatus Ratteibacteria) CG23_combo_of_CG06-09_8_20_14_all_48_7]